MENLKLTTSSRTKTRCTVWRKRTLTERYLFLICVVMFIALLITIGIIFHVKHVYKHLSPNVCKLPQCMLEAGRILYQMDTTVDPCDDFYDYGCGSFSKHHIPESQSNMLYDNIIKLTKEALEAPGEKEQPEFVKKVKQHYQSCINQSGDIADNIDKILKITNLKSWPILDDDYLTDNIEKSLAIINIYSKDNPLFSFHFSSNRREGPLRIFTAGVSLAKQMFINKTHELYIRQKEKYKSLLEYTLFAFNVHPEVMQDVVEEIIEFETKLANITHDEYEFNEIETTLKEFSSACEGVRWIYVIRYIYDYYGYSEDFNEKMTIKFFDKKEHLDDVCKLLSETSQRRIYNYIVWNFLLQNVWSSHSYFNVILNEITYDIEPYIPPPKWESCIQPMVYDVTNPGLNYLVIKYIEPEESIKEVQGYANNIRKAMDQTLSNERWLGAASKDIARKRVKDIQFEIGYSKASLDLDLLEKYFAKVNITDNFIETNLLLAEWTTGSYLSNDTLKFSEKIKLTWPLSKMTFYNDELIEIPLGYLLPPYFMSGIPKYINYGSVGLIISREVSYAFKDLDLNSTEENVEIWPKETVENFKEKKQCYVDQYSKLYSGHSEAKVYAESEFIENLAENSGIIHAFKAYENYVRENGEEPKLSGLDFSNEQLFFVKYAQSFCETENSDYGELSNFGYRISDSLPKYRVNGALQNFRPFSEAFNCPLDSPMNPKHKCQMYG